MRLGWWHETCKCCTREQRIAWFVSSGLWDAVVIDYFKSKVLCLECFLRMADDNSVGVEWNDIVVYGLISRVLDAEIVYKKAEAQALLEEVKE